MYVVENKDDIEKMVVICHPCLPIIGSSRPIRCQNIFSIVIKKSYDPHKRELHLKTCSRFIRNLSSQPGPKY